MVNGTDTVDEVLNGVVILSPTVYSWFGTRSDDLPRRVKQSLGADLARSYLVSTLSTQLYRGCYRQGRPVATDPVAASLARPAKERFLTDLAAANAGSGSWSPGWTVRSVDGDQLVLDRDGLRLWVAADEVHPATSDDAQPGAVVRLPLPPGSSEVSPGFYLVRGNVEISSHEPLVRLYWNLTAEGAPVLIRQATTELNGAGVPFNLKVVNAPELYQRCDAGVLYLPRSAYPAVEVLAGIYAAVGGLLRRSTPAFTKELAPGLGVAEDPGDGRSFGEHRCRLLAEGLVRAYELGATDRRAVVQERFADAGVSLQTPYLNLGSPDRYPRLPVSATSRHAAAAHQPATRSPHADRMAADRLLESAARIGRQLVDAAVWDGERCNWISLAPKEPTRVTVSSSTFTALGPDLYGGTSGIALFLAHLYAATGDDAVYRTALGAIRQALSRVGDVSPRNRYGLQTGLPGIAVATVRASAALAVPDLMDQARSLVARLVADTDEAIDTVDADAGRPEFDLIAGRAGAITGLLAIADSVGVPGLEAFTARLGDRLLATAEPSPAGLSWAGPDDFPTVHNLTGYSHGAAGVGAAFVELYRAIGDDRYRHGAEEAFRYERHWFDADEGNWPDLRGEPTGKRKRRAGPFPFLSAWCHGAPGIALSRLRAHAVLGDEVYYKEAATALQTTRERILRELPTQTGNYSLCHGFAGNADVLLHGWQAYGTDFSDDLLVAHEAARVGIEQYGAQGRPWPCLNGGEEALPLLVGVAGIGHFLLRLRDPGVPSILLVAPDPAPAPS
jgi:hypothetical protein